MRALTVLFLVLLAACGGGSTASVEPDPGPNAALDQFIRAVSDSNLARMAQLWGTSSGSAAETGKPSDYPRRIAIIHAYLRGSKVKVLAEPERSSSRAVLLVEVTRDDCRRQVPFTLTRTGQGQWLVEAIELGVLGSPGRPCAMDDRKPGDR
ncbi:MAG TPA: hypothetical protein VGA78_02820 [Gemmatimonadales bacterium]